MPKAKSKKRTKRQDPSPRHAKPTSHALRPINLPLDVLRQVVRFASCDPDTLANLARTCKDLYDMATPALYADVHLTSDEQVGRLLDDFEDDALCKTIRMRGKATRSGSKETLSSAQQAAITRLEHLQSTRKITLDCLPTTMSCTKMEDIANKLYRSSLCANVSTMLFASPVAESLHNAPARIAYDSFTIEDLGSIARLARPSHVCFRYTRVPSGCGCVSVLVEALMYYGMELRKVSVHAEAVDLRDHRISSCRQVVDFEVFLADKLRQASLPKHFINFAVRNRPPKSRDCATAIKIVTPECDTDILLEDMEKADDRWIKYGSLFHLTARSKTSPCEVCGGRLSSDTS
jgi:hypothetical protein